MPRFNRPSKLCSKHTEIQVFQREHSIKSGIDVKIQPTYLRQILINLQDNLSR